MTATSDTTPTTFEPRTPHAPPSPPGWERPLPVLAPTASTASVRRPVPAGADATVARLMGPVGLQLSDDVLVDTAIAVMCGARVDRLVTRDHDGRCSGMLTSAQLRPYRGRTWYREHLAVRDIVHDGGPYALAGMPAGTAENAMSVRGLAAWPVVDSDGYLIGVIARRTLAPESAERA
ncbi:CBS domain-containing protein [Kitasatospora sp. NBC_00315]|uniref:CBS domain-containing protein n=1 Tax=Kitasatospora sp. NBC_00315 TaxID=2975963 RepID=UPI003254855F